MEIYQREFKIGIDDVNPFNPERDGDKSEVSLLTVPFPYIEIIFTGKDTVFEASGYYRISSASITGVQSIPILTRLATNYSAYGVFFSPVELYEYTGLGYSDITGSAKISNILSVILTKLEESKQAVSKHQFTRMINEHFFVSNNKRDCYRVVTKFIEQVHALHNCRIHKISESLNYSSKHLRSTFKDIFGITPKRYLQLIQVQGVLKDMATDSGFSMTEIAYRNGFYDQSHFNQVFRRFSGMVPKKFESRYKLYASKYKNTIVL